MNDQELIMHLFQVSGGSTSKKKKNSNVENMERRAKHYIITTLH